MLISSSKVVEKAISAGLVAGVDVMEVTDCGMVVGIRIGEQIVRHNGVGWYEALDVDAAIGPENIPVSLTAGSVEGSMSRMDGTIELRGNR